MKDNKNHRILVVDDEIKHLKLMGTILKNYGYSYKTAGNGHEALAKTKEFSPDLIFLDVLMPEVDGFETCRKLKKDPITRHIPIIMVTAFSERESRIKGLKLGANDFISKPIDSTEVMVRAQNLIKAKEYEEAKKMTKEIKSALRKLSKSRDELKDSYQEMLHTLTAVAEYRDEETASHIQRIGHYCKLIAKNLGWLEEEQETISFASPLHDIGKVGIPAEILLKHGKLTPEEFALMKTHTAIGVRILRGAKSKYLQMAERIALTHHEKFDGTGYPHGLKGEGIPIEGRIAIIPDQYDSLRSSRPYKPKFEHEKAFKIITEGDRRTRPGHFDPGIFEIFKDCHMLFKEIYEKNQG